MLWASGPHKVPNENRLAKRRWAVISVSNSQRLPSASRLARRQEAIISMSINKSHSTFFPPSLSVPNHHLSAIYTWSFRTYGLHKEAELFNSSSSSSDPRQVRQVPFGSVHNLLIFIAHISKEMSVGWGSVRKLLQCFGLGAMIKTRRQLSTCLMNDLGDLGRRYTNREVDEAGMTCANSLDV